jgi:hypothetical protein
LYICSHEKLYILEGMGGGSLVFVFLPPATLSPQEVLFWVTEVSARMAILTLNATFLMVSRVQLCHESWVVCGSLSQDPKMRVIGRDNATGFTQPALCF